MPNKRKIVEDQGTVRKSARIANQRKIREKAEPMEEVNLENPDSDKNAIAERNEDPPSLLCLNDDCLLHILSFVQELRSLACLAMTCTRLRDLVEYSYKKLHILKLGDLIWYRPIDRSSFDRIALKIGPYVEKVDWLQTYSDILPELLPSFKHFTNIKELSIEDHYLDGNRDYYNFLATAFLTLEKITLINCNMFSIGEYFLRAKNLRYLSLTKCYIEDWWFGKLKNMKGIFLEHKIPEVSVLRKFFRQNPDLEEVQISYCYYYEPAHLTALFKYLKNLRLLFLTPIIENDEYIDMRRYKKLIDLPNLKHLKLHNGVNLSYLLQHLANLDNLESLDISYCQDTRKNLQVLASFKKLFKICAPNTKLDDSLLNDLASSEQLSQTLQTLDISSTSVTNEGVAQVVLKCKDLRYINLSTCENISDDLFTKIAPELENRGHKLYIKVFDTKVENKLRNRVIYSLHDEESDESDSE